MTNIFDLFHILNNNNVAILSKLLYGMGVVRLQSFVFKILTLARSTHELINTAECLGEVGFLHATKSCWIFFRFDLRCLRYVWLALKSVIHRWHLADLTKIFCELSTLNLLHLTHAFEETVTANLSLYVASPTGILNFS